MEFAPAVQIQNVKRAEKRINEARDKARPGKMLLPQ